MAGQQKVGNALLDGVLMPTVPTDQFPVGDTRFYQERMQIFQCLCRLLGLCFDKIFLIGRLLGQCWETQLQSN